MKTLLFCYTVKLFSFFFIVFSSVSCTMAIEKAKYNILEVENDFEVRQYEPQIVAETFVEGEFEAVGNEGFRRLYKYITGYNQKEQSISMTAPVNQEAKLEKIAMTAPVSQEKEGKKWRITFLMPANYTLDSLPSPLDVRVKLKAEPGRRMATVKYSGRWSKKLFEKKKARLKEFIDKRGLIQVGEPVWARYDPPFMPWFLRRNEVLIPVQW
jgi:hypothetical protein